MIVKAHYGVWVVIVCCLGGLIGYDTVPISLLGVLITLIGR